MVKAKTIPLEEGKLERFIRELFEASGLSSRHSQIVFSSILYAERRGLSSHGLIRVPHYLRRLEKGGICARPRIRVLQENSASALMDGDRAMGQISGTMAMKKAVNLAKTYNVGVVSLRRGSHFGAAGYFSSMAAEKNYIGIALSNTSAIMAPTGGRQAVIGNNPISVAVPSAGRFPLVLDFALSISAQGKIEVARAQGKAIPLNVALDPRGRPTTDPTEALAGTVLPAGGYKGYGSALMVDILCGVLAGGSFGPQVGSLIKGDDSKPTDKSFFFLALKISAFCPLREFKRRVADYVELIKTSQPASGAKEIFVPGEIEWRHDQENLDKPIMIEPKVYEALIAKAEGLGVARP